MKLFFRFILIAPALLLPAMLWAQDGSAAGEIHGLQATLDTVYKTMLGKCGELVTVARGIAAFGTIFYIGSRVWGHLARAEAIDLYPLLRPFVLGFTISIWPLFISLCNNLLQPTVAGTAALVNDSNKAVSTLLQQKADALKNSTDWQMYVGPSGDGDLEKWEELSDDADNGPLSGLSNRIKFQMAKAAYNFKNQIKVWLSEILQVLFEAAALCINTVRSFYLLILAILGPLVFALSVFDGFHHVLNAWLAKYINIFLWVPIANIFGSLIGQIQQEMIKLDIKQLQATGQTTFGQTDAAYIVFLILAIVGYTTVPSIANYIISAGQSNSHLRKVTNTVSSGAGATWKSIKDLAKQERSKASKWGARRRGKQG